MDDGERRTDANPGVNSSRRVPEPTEDDRTARQVRSNVGHLTMSMPVIVGWSVQKYGNSPRSLAVYFHERPSARMWESNCRLRAVTVWGKKSLFFHTMMSPRRTVRDCGWKLVPSITTS